MIYSLLSLCSCPLGGFEPLLTLILRVQCWDVWMRLLVKMKSHTGTASGASAEDRTQEHMNGKRSQNSTISKPFISKDLKARLVP